MTEFVEKKPKKHKHKRNSNGHKSEREAAETVQKEDGDGNISHDCTPKKKRSKNVDLLHMEEKNVGGQCHPENGRQKKKKKKSHDTGCEVVGNIGNDSDIGLNANERKRQLPCFDIDNGQKSMKKKKKHKSKEKEMHGQYITQDMGSGKEEYAIVSKKRKKCKQKDRKLLRHNDQSDIETEVHESVSDSELVRKKKKKKKKT